MILPIKAMPLPMMKNLVQIVSLVRGGDRPTSFSPSSSEDIRQLANHEEDDGAEHDVRERYPENVGRRTNVLVDLGQNRRNEAITCRWTSALVN